jgi:hypothetical protein
MSTAAARDVLAERQRQISVEGWAPEHDDKYSERQLAYAAACYAAESPQLNEVVWPWPSHWWKPTTYRRNLVKAGALILAEIERLDRIAARPTDEATIGGIIPHGCGYPYCGGTAPECATCGKRKAEPATADDEVLLPHWLQAPADEPPPKDFRRLDATAHSSNVARAAFLAYGGKAFDWDTRSEAHISDWTRVVNAVLTADRAERKPVAWRQWSTKWQDWDYQTDPASLRSDCAKEPLYAAPVDGSAA